MATGVAIASTTKERSVQKLIVILVMLVVGTAHAEKKKNAMVDTKTGYGLAGCGLGSMIFGAKEGGIQIVASTTNGTAGNQTFGITTGTLNCDISRAGTQAAVYIESNREVVVKEAARGEGETLVGLANILNCGDQAAFNKAAQSNFEKIFVNSDNAYTNVHSLVEVINSNPTLKNSCNI